MNSLKLTLAGLVAITAAFITINATETLTSPDKAANTTNGVAAATETKPVMGHMGSGRMAAGNAHCGMKSHEAAAIEAKAHCKTPKTGAGRMSCCN